MPLLTEIKELLALLVHELSILCCLFIVHVHQVQHQWPPGHNACSTREKVPANNSFQH